MHLNGDTEAEAYRHAGALHRVGWRRWRAAGDWRRHRNLLAAACSVVPQVCTILFFISLLGHFTTS